ncbi:putative glucose transporter rco-3 [Pseudocercospora fuligena]|uniref:Putative glucose transporter rco-3 n=1 Tax=Pseudocercospora fuligena TaxID=685502 RepID=A0A8H6VSK6_9PEZI|nr:putative glucose transporter rco-3 [Pseudocercospora fuligena]
MDTITTTVTSGSDHEPISYGPAGFQGLLKQPYGVISGVLVMNNFSRLFPSLSTNPTLQGWMVSVLTLGAMFGAFINGPISEIISRKRSIFYANIVFLIGSVLQAAAQNVLMILVGRFFAGVSIGMLAMVTPLYLSELSPPEIRGALVTLQQFAITIGILGAFWLEYGTQYIGGNGDGQSEVAWRLPLALQCLPSAVLAIGTFFLPFSPRWLVNQGREKEAFETLVKLRRVPEGDSRLSKEILEIRVAYLFEQESLKAKYGDRAGKFEIAVQQYKELFTIGHLRKRTIIACGLQVVEQFTGINAIIYYAPTIFKALSLSSTSITLLATGVVGIINVLFTIPSLYFIDRLGRRKLLIIGAIGMSISQLVVGSLFAAYKDTWSSHRAAGWVACTFVWIYIATFAFQVGVIWIMPSEMFHLSFDLKLLDLLSRRIGWVCILASRHALCLRHLLTSYPSVFAANFIVGLITPRMLKKISFGTFYFFLVFCVILLGWSWWGIPETKGVPIEEMDKIFGGNEGADDVRRMEEIRMRLERQDSVTEETVVTELKGKC